MTGGRAWRRLRIAAGSDKISVDLAAATRYSRAIRGAIAGWSSSATMMFGDRLPSSSIATTRAAVAPSQCLAGSSTTSDYWSLRAKARLLLPEPVDALRARTGWGSMPSRRFTVL